MTDAVPPTRLADATWRDPPGLPERPLLLVPLGAVEQHGHHLPPATDTTVACAVAEAAVADLEGAVVAPALAYGAGGEHGDVPGTVTIGTVSLGTEALTGLLVEYGRSVCRWAGRLVLVNGHGGNLEALRAAGAQLQVEGREVAWFPCGDAHAGRTETPVMLHVEPDPVREDGAAAGDTTSIAELLPRLRAEGVRAAGPTGVLGDPSGASAEEGSEPLTGMAGRLAAAVRAWEVDPAGRLRG